MYSLWIWFCGFDLCQQMIADLLARSIVVQCKIVLAFLCK